MTQRRCLTLQRSECRRFCSLGELNKADCKSVTLQTVYQTWRGMCDSWMEGSKNVLILHLISATVVRN